MKKFGTWLLNHLGLVLGIVTFTVTLGVIGGVMLKSHNDYLEYEKEFYRTDLEIRSISAAQPNYIEIDDSFVSSNANKQVLTADKLTVTTTQESYLKDGVIDITEKGGTIAAKMKLEKMSFVDIDFEVATEYVKEAASEEEEDEYGVKDLISNVQFIVNGETMEEEGVDLVEKGFHHLVMVDFALPAGDVAIEIKNLSNKAKLVPQLKTITFYSSEVLTIAETEAN